MQTPDIIEVESRKDCSLHAVSHGRLITVPLGKITHIRKHIRGAVIYLERDTIPTPYNLQEMMRRLPQDDFYRVHRSFIISLKWMDGAIKGHVRVAGQYIPISNYYKVQMIAQLQTLLDKLMSGQQKNF